jgi:hypothetical protein
MPASRILREVSVESEMQSNRKTLERIAGRTRRQLKCVTLLWTRSGSVIRRTGDGKGETFGMFRRENRQSQYRNRNPTAPFRYFRCMDRVVTLHARHVKRLSASLYHINTDPSRLIVKLQRTNIWRFESSEVWRCADRRGVPEGSFSKRWRHHGIVETSGTIQPTTRRHITQDLSPQQRRCLNLLTSFQMQGNVLIMEKLNGN